MAVNGSQLKFSDLQMVDEYDKATEGTESDTKVDSSTPGTPQQGLLSPEDIQALAAEVGTESAWGEIGYTR